MTTETTTTETPKTLPPDPEGMNDARAGWAERALSEFMRATGTDREDAICDLIADLRHWADRNGQDFDHEADRGRRHYEAEIGGEEP